MINRIAKIKVESWLFYSWKPYIRSTVKEVPHLLFNKKTNDSHMSAISLHKARI